MTVAHEVERLLRELIFAIDAKNDTTNIIRESKFFLSGLDKGRAEKGIENPFKVIEEPINEFE